jgi:hypothetical protein
VRRWRRSSSKAARRPRVAAVEAPGFGNRRRPNATLPHIAILTGGAQTEEYGDMFKFGVIDPAKVVRTALQDAASVAGLLITTEAMIADKPEPKGQAGGGMPGGMGGGMGGMDDY